MSKIYGVNPNQVGTWIFDSRQDCAKALSLARYILKNRDIISSVSLHITNDKVLKTFLMAPPDESDEDQVIIGTVQNDLKKSYGQD